MTRMSSTEPLAIDYVTIAWFNINRAVRDRIAATRFVRLLCFSHVAGAFQEFQ